MLAKGGDPATECPACRAKLPLDADRCIVCQGAVDFPNVRYAWRAEEAAAFKKFSGDADQAIALAGTGEIAARFQAAANQSQAVMNRHMNVVQQWLCGPTQLFHNFHADLVSGRIPVDDTWNRQRTSAENAVSPHFYNKLSVAALTLDNTGMSYYGPIAVVLNENMIGSRATVFEENPFGFHERHGQPNGKDPEPGHRAGWRDRGRLALNKLHHQLAPNTEETAFPDLIMGRNRIDPACDFIEVHIWGAIHTQAISRIVAKPPEDEIDLMLWGLIKHHADKAGLEVRED